MKASDLLGREVVDAAGTPIGVVTDIRCVQDGPLRGANAALRVDGLLVSRHHTGSVLGYDRRKQGPWAVRVLVAFLHRHMTVVPWRDVADEGPPIRLRS
ncbi:MAG TPA: PRC-barrel domain-containing protein [Jatrophihabitantaceae bacterium]|nr:PRC-barrel domain-containing protein [Jatrophihabitantaceae bacterium]